LRIQKLKLKGKPKKLKCELLGKRKKAKIRASKEAEEAKIRAEEAKIRADELKARHALEMKQAENDMLLKKLTLEAELKAEFEKQRIAADLKVQELAVEKLKIEAATASAGVHTAPVVTVAHAPSFRLDQAIKLLPRFNEKSVEEYLITFEKIAEINSWPTDRYASILQAVLVGKGLKVFSELTTDECKNYDTLKESLLQAYSVVSEVHRHRFRTCVKQPSETFADFAFVLGVHFKRWLQGEEAFEDVARMREVLKLEQFCERLTPELHTWLIDRAPKTLAEAAKFADEYTAIRKAQNRAVKPNFYGKTGQQQFTNKFRGADKKADDVANENADTAASTSPVQTSSPNSPIVARKNKNIVCYFCQKSGHVRKNCHAYARAEEQRKKQGASVVQHTIVSNVTSDKDLSEHVIEVDGRGKPIHPLFHTHWCTVKISRPDGSEKSVKMLRDSGSLQLLISRDHTTADDYVDTGEFRLIHTIGGITKVPLVEIRIDSKYGKGTFLFGLVDTLPDASFGGLIGNDLVPPVIEELDECLPVGNVVTRAQAAAMCKSSDNSLTDKVNKGESRVETDHIIEDKTVNMDTDLSVLFKETAQNVSGFTDGFIDAIDSRDKLIELQRNDETLTHLYSIVQPETEELNGSSLFYLNNDVLMRKWRHKTSPNIIGTECTQIVVPKVLRAELLYIAHDIPLSAHLGIAKTKARLEAHFYWPSLTQDVKLYVNTCDMCQRLGKGGKPQPALLHNLPVVTEPFKRIAIDIVGPLPVCVKTGNRFILTVIDFCTHYVEAIPLQSHEAPVVAKALMTVFSHFGFPDELLSDCGPELMSDVMKIFLKDFGIRHITSSPYHPQCNGSCERFNGTMKSMLRALSEQYPDTWDQTVPWILFAYREVPVETLGFSPFELLFARQVPGPLALLKNGWLHASKVKSSKKSVVQFVLDMRERLRESIAQASEHAKQQNLRSKIWYDKLARTRSFDPGQEVLALLPLAKNPLQAKYFGPYKVVEKLGPVDYLIDTPGRRKTQRVCHVNLLKLYRRRDDKLFPRLAVGSSAQAAAVHVCGTSDYNEQDFGNSIPAFQDLKHSAKFDDKVKHLPEMQRKQLQAVLNSFVGVFKDQPGRTTLITHHIKLKEGSRPVAVAQYRLNPEKKCEFATAEIDYLGHHIGLGKVMPKQKKVEALVAFGRPTTKKQLQSFIGLAGFYRKYIPHFASLSACLTDLLKKGAKWIGNDDREKAFLDIKSRLASRPILVPPDYSKQFIVAVDSSDLALGATLLQEKEGLEHPICYLSRKLNEQQKRYSIVEKEALALLVAVRAFSVYFGSAPIKVYTDHSPLQFLERMAPHNAKLLRWCLELQQYNLQVVHRPGKSNLFPDYLSRPSV
jgi:hypothetical protein